MRPIKISLEAQAQRPWLEAIEIGPPPSVTDGSIGSLPALVGFQADFEGAQPYPVIRFGYKPDEDELKILNNGGTIWIQFESNIMYPVSATVEEV